MIQDEYNKVEITNDKQLLRVEFGKTQLSEFTSKKENTVPEGDLNEKYVGKTIKKVTEVNVEYVKKIPTHTTTTVVQSSATTATSAAAAAASTVVAASTVAVVAVSVVTGISVALHDYQCELSSLLITSNEINYRMTIIDNKKEDDIDYQSYEEPRQRNPMNDIAGDPYAEEESDIIGIYNKNRPFVLKVSNNYYEAEHYLDYGMSEEACFSGLTLGDTYSIVLSENRYGGQVLYNESFTTYKNSAVRDFYISGAADYRNRTFEVYMNYIDELEALNGFYLTLTDTENSESVYSYELDMVDGWQTVSVNSDNQQTSGLDFEKTYNYAFSYKKGEDVIDFSNGKVNFYNTNYSVSEVTGVSWDHKANFLTDQMEVTLAFVDDYEIFSNFKFVLVQEEPVLQDPQPLVYNLEKTVATQTIDLYDNEEFDYNATYSYMFKYMEEGKDVEQIIESDSGFRFEDNSGAISEVYGVNWDKTANFIDRSFTVTLDFQDDFYHFSEFQLTLTDAEIPDEVSETFALEKTTDPQTITLEDSPINFRRSYKYEFSYLDESINEKNIIESGEVQFADNSNGKKEFRTINIDQVPDLTNRRIGVTLDFDDDYDELSTFLLTIYTNADDAREIYLDKTTDKQYFDIDQYEIDVNSTYYYSFKYYDAETESDYTVVEEGTLIFDVSGFTSQFNELIFDETGNFDTMAFDIQLDYVDDFNYYSEFTLTMRDDYQHEKVFNLEKTTDVQTLYLDDKEQHEEDGEIWESNVYTMRASTFTYTFSYYDASISDYVSSQSDPFTFTNTLTSTFTNIVSPFDFTADEYDQSFMIPLRFEFDDKGQLYEGFDVQIFKGEDSLGSLRFEGDTKTESWLYGVFVPDGIDISEVINADDTSIKVFAYINSDENPNFDDSVFEDPIYSKDVTFTLGQDHQIYGGWITYEHIMYNMDIGFQLVYSGNPEDFANCELVLESLESGNIYRFTISQLSPGMNYTTIYMDSDVVGDAISESDFQEDFIAHPMKISVTYYTSDNEGPYTTVLHNSFQFYESV